MLEYENQMFLDILHEDGLLVAAKGLSLDTVFLNIVKVFSDPGNLVLVVGTTAKEEEFYMSQLLLQGINPLPKVITNEYTSADREIVYLEGGILFITPRILVVDLLKNRVPVANVTGFLVYRAHAILESCQEAFAVRLYRQKNKTGFVKAFSSSPQSFTQGFAHVQHIMKTLFVRNLYLWPRFHANVKTSLDKNKLTVIELHVDMTTYMLQIQAAVLDLIRFSVKELKQLNPSVDMDEVTVENAISKSFHKVLQLQLDPMWHTLSLKTKQILSDLRTLRIFLTYLTRYDCVTFHNMVSNYRGVEYALKCSGWLLLEAAETLFVVAKHRATGCVADSTDSKKAKEINPEPCPKWKVLSEVLEEINTIAREHPDQTERVLILMQDRRTCDQLKQYLMLGAQNMLLHLYEKTFKCRVPHKSGPFQPEESADDPQAPEDVPKQETGEKQEDAYVDDDLQERYMLSQKPPPEGDESGGAERITGSQYEEIKEEKPPAEVEQVAARPPVVILQPFKKNDDPLTLTKTLMELKPRFIIMYDIHMASVRRLEVFNCLHPEVQLQVYLLVYGGSVEEQAYLTTLRREKEAFEFLIKEKAVMAVPQDQAGLSSDNLDLLCDLSKPSETVNTRKGGTAQATESKKQMRIIVDMREFRSELPALIHRRDIEVEPVTLQVGDYILTPEICVERKSVSDLIGSLNSGRLYNQAIAMTRHYAKPMLLIEFDQNKPFVLQGQYFVSSNVSSSDVTAKLQLLTLHFPHLRLVWSPSPYATAELFQELKQGQMEPDPTVASAIGVELQKEIDMTDKYNAAIQDLVAKLPGVTTKNLQMVLGSGMSLSHLLTFSKETLSSTLQNSTQAKELHGGLHGVHRPPEDPGPINRGFKGYRRGRGKGFRKFSSK